MSQTINYPWSHYLDPTTLRLPMIYPETSMFINTPPKPPGLARWLNVRFRRSCAILSSVLEKIGSKSDQIDVSLDMAGLEEGGWSLCLVRLEVLPGKNGNIWPKKSSGYEMIPLRKEDSQECADLFQFPWVHLFWSLCKYILIIHFN